MRSAATGSAATPDGRPASASLSRRALLLGGSAAALLTACSTPPARSSPGEVVITTFSSAPPGSVNSHLIVTPAGVIVIDFQRQISQALLLRQLIQLTGRPVLAMVLTHAHPDHFGGLTTLLEAFPDAPCHATADTTRRIRDDVGGLGRRQPGHPRRGLPGHRGPAHRRDPQR